MTEDVGSGTELSIDGVSNETSSGRSRPVLGGRSGQTGGPQGGNRFVLKLGLSTRRRVLVCLTLFALTGAALLAAVVTTPLALSSGGPHTLITLAIVVVAAFAATAQSLLDHVQELRHLSGNRRAACKHDGIPAGARPRRDRNVLKVGIAACRRAFLVVGLFTIAVNLLLLTVPIYLFQVSDRVLASRSSDTLIMLTIVAFGALLVLGLLDLLRRFVLTRVSIRLESILGGSVFAASLDASGVRASKDIQGLRDLAQLRTFVSGPVVPLIFDVPVAPFYIFIVYLIHPQLGYLALGGAVALFMIAISNQLLTARPLARLGGHSIMAFAHAQGHARNAEVIQAMGMLSDCERLWGQENAEALRAQAQANDRNAFLTGFSKFLRLVLQIGILGWGTYLALQGELTAGMMIAASIIAGRALQPIEGSIEGWRSSVQALMAYRRIKALLESRGADVEHIRLPTPQGRLAVEKLTYVPPGLREPILRDISFELLPGESLAVIGPTGVGKSTLARLMVGVLAPVAGSVRLDGTDVRNWDREQFGTHTGYLPQDVELFPGTVAANISRMKPEPDPADIIAAANLACVHELITHLPNGYETVIGVDGAPLSGGQRQRVALARAFFRRPCFVVLDEPNANLDGQGEEALADALGKAKAQGVTIVTITQRPSVLRNVDKIMLLQRGQIEAFGPRREVLTRLIRAQRAQRGAAEEVVPGQQDSSVAHEAGT